MSEQTVSDERIKRLAEICTDPPERLFPWVYKLAGRSNDIAAICRELLARREADRLAEVAERDAEDAKRMSRVREEVRVEYTKRIERANHLRDGGFNGSQIHLIELEASCYLRVIGIIDRLTAPAAGASE